MSATQTQPPAQTLESMAATLAKLRAEKAELEARLAKAEYTCPFASAEEFLGVAGEVGGFIGETEVGGKPRQFSSGSYGWNINGKVCVVVDGKKVKCQVSGNVVVIGSKPKAA